jgi:hypothetical protein
MTGAKPLGEREETTRERVWIRQVLLDNPTR